MSTYAESEREKAWQFAKQKGWAVDEMIESPTLRTAGPPDFLLQYPSTFESILNNQLPANVVYSDDQVAAIFDIQPVAPIHIVSSSSSSSSSLLLLLLLLLFPSSSFPSSSSLPSLLLLLLLSSSSFITR